MSENTDATFPVKIVFRGLFLAARGEREINIYLPDATSPAAAIENETNPVRQALLAGLQPLREHQAAIELPLADWDNPSELTPRLVQLHKPTKEPVALYLLRKEDIEIGGLYGDPRDLPTTPKVTEGGTYEQVGDVRLLARHDKFGWNQLAGFESDLNEPEAIQGVCAAATVIRFGEVCSERRSLRGDDEERGWLPRSVLCGDYITPEVREAQKLPEAPPDGESRPLNLDLVVRFRLRASNPLQIVCKPREGGAPPRSFILRPRAPGAEVTVWIKNRELEAILRDSDLDPDPYLLLVDPDHDATDRDHAIYMRLAKDPLQSRVPRDDRDDASDSGSGCGGAVHPPGG